MARARRQPGSTLKPFVYALAFAGRPQRRRDDRRRRDLLHRARRCPTPPRTSTAASRAPIPLREALAGSLNIPAVRLADEVGPEAPRPPPRLGFASLTEPADHYGLALALGSGEVELRELAAAYATLARGGEHAPRCASPSDHRYPRPATAGARDRPAVAALVTEVLSDPLARVRGLHGRGPFSMPYPVAVKTGTSSGYRDTWTVGYTRERTVAVWLGNADSAQTVPHRRLRGRSPVRRRHGTQHARRPQPRPAVGPRLLVAVDVCPLSGLPASPACDEHVTRHFAHDHLPEGTCDLHHHVTRDPSRPRRPALRRERPRGRRPVPAGVRHLAVPKDRQPRPLRPPVAAARAGAGLRRRRARGP
jgi:penicillin-binding protein 1C